jgi:hypothetical protein
MYLNPDLNNEKLIWKVLQGEQRGSKMSMSSCLNNVVKKFDILKFGRMKFFVSEIKFWEDEKKKYHSSGVSGKKRGEISISGAPLEGILGDTSEGGAHPEEDASASATATPLALGLENNFNFINCRVIKNEEIIRESSQNDCKICLSKEVTSDNPLISICNCSGTIKFTHIRCLEPWLSQKIYISNSENVKKIKCYKFYCELCKFPFPSNYFTYQ